MAAMRRINLDYQQPAERPRRAAGWALLAAGLALLFEMGVSYDKLHNERQAMTQEMRAAGLRLDLAGKTAGSARYTDKDAEAARDIMNRLSAPWEDFFASIESIKNDKVAILSMDPDMQTGQLTIEGEAKDYPALLTLVSQFRMKRTFADVFLQRHEIRREDPQHPMTFTISMRWVRPS